MLLANNTPNVHKAMRLMMDAAKRGRTVSVGLNGIYWCTVESEDSEWIGHGCNADMCEAIISACEQAEEHSRIHATEQK